MTALAPADRLIIPLDVPDVDAAIALIDRIPNATFWKVGLELFVSTGPALIEQLKARGKRIFLDLKFHDIPNTVAGACRAAARYDVDLLTLHATAGRAALEAAVTAAQEGADATGCTPPTLLAITLLTSLSSRDLAFDLKVPIELPEFALAMAKLAQESGLGGAVCSPQEAAELRRVCGSEFTIVCPGVRPSWASKGDQSRVMTPAEAIAAGASYLVIGRPITQADDPAAAFDRVCAEL
jgi:orotidine-5'-phosphate decarboxylase